MQVVAAAFLVLSSPPEQPPSEDASAHGDASPVETDASSERPEGPLEPPDASALLGPPEATDLQRWAEVDNDDPLRFELDPDAPFERPPNWALGFQRETWSLTLRPLDTSTTTPDGRRVFDTTHETLGERPFIRPLALSALPNAGDQAWSGFTPAGAGVALALDWRLGQKSHSPRMGAFASLQALGNGLVRADERRDTVAAQRLGEEASWSPETGVAAVIGVYLRF